MAATTVPAHAAVEENTIYALDWSGGVVSTINPSTAVMTPLFTTSPAVEGAAAMFVDPDSSDLIVPTWNTNPYPVWSVDLTAQTTTSVSATGMRVTGAATTAAGTYVVADVAGGGGESELATFDAATGTYTPIASVTLDGIAVRVSALANCGGTVYAFAYDHADALYTIDLATADLTLVSAATEALPAESSLYAADCAADGSLFAVDGENLYSTLSARAPLTLVGPLSGAGYSRWLETMAIYVSAESLDADADGTGGDAGENLDDQPRLAETGSDESITIRLGIVAAGLLLAGNAALSARRRRPRATTW